MVMSFPNEFPIKARILRKTNMNTDPGFERCFRAVPLVDELPEGFTFLFSHRSITNYQLGGTSKKYQVTLTGDRYVQLPRIQATNMDLHNLSIVCHFANDLPTLMVRI